MKEKTRSLTFRIPISLYEKLKKEAERTKRSLASTIVYRLFKNGKSS